MNRLRRLFVLIPAFCAVAVLACSSEKSPKNEAAPAKPVTEQAKEAIQDYGRRPIGEARKTQTMGQDRVKGIDEAMKTIDK
jgi:hypothetical protein